jgi:hypothetical protein
MENIRLNATNLRLQNVTEAQVSTLVFLKESASTAQNMTATQRLAIRQVPLRALQDFT